MADLREQIEAEKRRIARASTRKDRCSMHQRYMRRTRLAAQAQARVARKMAAFECAVDDSVKARLTQAVEDVADELGLKAKIAKIQERDDGTGRVSFSLSSKGTVLFPNIELSIYKAGDTPQVGSVEWPSMRIFQP